MADLYSGVLSGAQQGAQNPFGSSAVSGASQILNANPMLKQMLEANAQRQSAGMPPAYAPELINQSLTAAGLSPSDLTVIGQGEAWMSPDELRAKTNSLGGMQSGDTGGGSLGSAGGAAGGSPQAGQVGSSGGLLSGGTGVPAPQNSSPNGINSFPNFGGGGLTNYLPGNSSLGGSAVGGGGSPSNYLPMGGSSSQVGGGNSVAMMQQSPQNGMQSYFNTPGYQLTNGAGAVNNFQTSPGYQFAVNQALGQVQQNAASRGLLDSGAGLRAMTDRAHGMANQEFGNWQNRQNQMYNDYQNRLAGLAGGPTGAEQAYGLGQGMGTNAMQTGNNIGSLLANQGNSLFGGIVGAGGAQAQNINNAGNMQAQILSGNMSTQLAAAALGGQRNGY